MNALPLALRIAQSRQRVRHAATLIREGQALQEAGRRLLDLEERRWGLRPSWRAPEIRAAKRADFAPFVVAAAGTILAVAIVMVAILS